MYVYIFINFNGNLYSIVGICIWLSMIFYLGDDNDQNYFQYVYAGMMLLSYKKPWLDTDISLKNRPGVTLLLYI